MKKLIYLFVFWLAAVNYACEQAGGGGAEGEKVDTSNLAVTDIPGSEVKRVERKTPDGVLMEEGFMRGDLKTGTWAYYEADRDLPAKLISYIDGKYNGLYLEFNDRGQINLRATYKNNQLHGPWAKYRFGRPEEEAYYQNGKLDGVHKVYFVRTGKLQASTEYKNGVQDGWYRFYNEDGEVTLEYEYRNGEKVGGGIVNPEKENEPQ